MTGSPRPDDAGRGKGAGKTVERVDILTRRQLLQLTGLVAAGYGASLFLRRMVPLGRDVSGNAVAQAVLRDREAPREGPPGADVTLAVFTDYQCPACRKAEPDLRMALREDHGVAVIYKDWPIFGPISRRAARVALAADRQSLYPQVHHALMRERRVLEPDVLRQLVESVGGRWSRIEHDLEAHGGEIDAALARTTREAFALGLAGTPAFVIGSRLIEGALGRGEFLRAFSAARKAAPAGR